MSNHRENAVREFSRAGGKGTITETPEYLPVVFRCIEEEYAEFLEAAKHHVIDGTVETRAHLCKEWADLQYVVSQAAVFFDIPGDASFNRVHASNMTKVVEGKVRFREDGKILKPDTYQEPDMRGL